MTQDQTKVVIANRWTDAAGTVHKGGDIVEVSPADARALKARGKARDITDADLERAAAEAAEADSTSTDPEPAPADPEADAAPAASKPAARRAAKKEEATQ